MNSPEIAAGPKNKTEKLKETVHLCAKVLGISKEGLRFYEQKGVLNPEHDANTGYRMYGGDEIFAVIACRKYRKYGFDLKKAGDLIHQTSSGEVLRQFRTQQDALSEEIQEKTRILSSLRSKTKQLEDILSWQGKFSIVTRPALYWVPVQRNQIPPQKPYEIERTRRWSGLSPYMDIIIIWPREKLLGEEGTIIAGCMVEEKDAGTLPIHDGNYLPEAKCLYTVNETQEYTNMTETIFQDMMDYMREKSLTPTGDAVARIIYTFVDEMNTYHFFAQLWIPIQ